MGTPTKDLSPDMKTLSAIFLMSLVNLTGCVADQATFNRAGDMRIINGEVVFIPRRPGRGMSLRSMRFIPSMTQTRSATRCFYLRIRPVCQTALIRRVKRGWQSMC